jgi:hypothetical protein
MVQAIPKGERGELADPWAWTDRRRFGGRRATD